MHSLLPFILSLAIIIYDYRCKSPLLAFSSAIFLVFTMPHLFSSLFVNEYSAETYFYVTAQATIFLFFYGVIIFFLRVFFKSKHNAIAQLGQLSYVRSEFFVALFLVFFFVFTVLASFDFSLSKLLYSNWADFREDTSHLKLIGNFSFFAGSGFFLLTVLSKNRALIISSVLLVIFIAVLLKTRSYVIALIIPYLIYYILNSKIKPRNLIVSFLIGAFVFSIYSSARFLRHAGSIDDLANQNIEFKLDSGEFELVNNLYFFVDQGGINHEIEFPTFIRLVLLPIPSSILKVEKPSELSHVLWDEKIGLRNIGGSLHVTVIGDSILQSFYFGAFFLSIFYAIFLFSIERFFLSVTSGKVLLFSLICTLSFYLARGAVYNGILMFFISSLIVMFFLNITKFKVRDY